MIKSSFMEEVNLYILRRYVLMALVAHNLLSDRLVRDSAQKTFTIRVYGDEINYFYGSRLMYANEKDFNYLLQFLVSQVVEKFGKERMAILKRPVGNLKADDLESVGKEWLQKWRSGEDWPLD